MSPVVAKYLVGSWQRAQAFAYDLQSRAPSAPKRLKEQRKHSFAYCMATRSLRVLGLFTPEGDAFG